MKRRGETIYGPEIISRGFVFDDQGQFILEDAECIVFRDSGRA